MAEDLRLAAGGLDEAEKHFDGGAFAGAVGAEETKDFAATDLERKTANRDLGAELFVKADGFDGQVIGRRQRVLRQFQVRGELKTAVGKSFLRG